MLIILGSSTAFNDVIGLVTSGYYSSYFIALSLLLYRRCTGAIRKPHDEDQDVVNNVGKRLVWGPWRIPGIWGIAINSVALAYLALALFWSFWPPEAAVTAKDMNYNVLVFGGVMLVAVLYYVIWGKATYSGPVVEVDGSTGYES